MTEILIKRLSKNIPLPKYETDGSSGMDLSANIEKEIEIAPGETSIISTGLTTCTRNSRGCYLKPACSILRGCRVSLEQQTAEVTAAGASPWYCRRARQILHLPSSLNNSTIQRPL